MIYPKIVLGYLSYQSDYKASYFISQHLLKIVNATFLILYHNYRKSSEELFHCLEIDPPICDAEYQSFNTRVLRRWSYCAFLEYRE